MLDRFFPDIWANVLPYLSQFDLNRLIRLSKAMNDNEILQNEIIALFEWTEERVDIPCINRNYLFIDANRGVDSSGIISINYEESTRFGYCQDYINHSHMKFTKYQCMSYHNEDKDYLSSKKFIIYDRLLSQYELIKLSINVCGITDTNKFLDNVIYILIGNCEEWRRVVFDRMTFTGDYDHVNINYYYDTPVKFNITTPVLLQYPPKCKIYVKTRIYNAHIINADVTRSYYMRTIPGKLFNIWLEIVR